jgi:hypothetical protein
MTLPKEIQSKYNLLKQATYSSIGLSESTFQESVENMFFQNQKQLDCKLLINLIYVQEMALQVQLATTIITK